MKDNELKKDFRINYITHLGILVASNIYAIYNHYKNDYGLSFNSILEKSTHNFELDTKEKGVLMTVITQALKEEYNLKIVSKNNEELKLKIYERR